MFVNSHRSHPQHGNFNSHLVFLVFYLKICYVSISVQVKMKIICPSITLAIYGYPIKSKIRKQFRENLLIYYRMMAAIVTNGTKRQMKRGRKYNKNALKIPNKNIMIYWK